jgi:prophage regulatory protein
MQHEPVESTLFSNHTDLIRFINRREVEHITGMSRSWLYQAMAEGRFPKSVDCSAASVRWVLSEVQGWMETRVRERDELVLEKNACKRRKSAS